MATNTIAVITAENKTFYDKKLIKRMLPQVHFYNDAQKRTLPTKNGTTIDFRLFNGLSIPEASLTEGVTPAGKSLNVTNMTAVVKQEGDFIEVSDMLKKAGIDQVTSEATDILSEQASLTIDTRIQQALLTGTNVSYSGGKTSSTLTKTDVITELDIKKLARKLKKANAKKFSDGYYHAIVDPDQAFDIMNLAGWVDIGKYVNGTQLLKGEIGKMYGIRFMESTNLQTEEVGLNDAKFTKHKAFAYGADSYGVVELDGNGKPEIIVKDLGSSGTADALNQRATVAWKACFTAKILQPACVIRLETAVSV
ncbi:MAG: N4-gp56 family major capsid protein [Clostridia bacterium]